MGDPLEGLGYSIVWGNTDYHCTIMLAEEPAAQARNSPVIDYPKREGSAFVYCLARLLLAAKSAAWTLSLKPRHVRMLDM